MISKQTAYRILWGVTMAVSAVVYGILVPDPLGTWAELLL